MPDRSAFWPPVPDWSRAVREAPGLCLRASEPAVAWQLSGAFAPVLAGLGVIARGPRECCEGEAYALRLAPDCALLLGASPPGVTAGGWTDGLAASPLADGIVCIDVEGERAAALMACGSEYPFEAAPAPAQECARLLFAGLRVGVVRRPQGWRLHVERPWAAALWHWLEDILEQGAA